MSELVPHPSGMDQEGRLLVAISRPAAVVAALVTLLAWIPGVTAAPLASSLVSGLATAFFLLTIVLVRWGRSRLASWLLLAVTYSAATATVILFSGLMGPNPSVYLVLVLFAGLLRGWRVAIAVAALAGLTLAVLLLLERFGAMPTPLAPVTPMVSAAVYAGVAVMVAAFLGAYLRQLDEATEATAASNRAALRSEQRLAELVAGSPDGVLALSTSGEILDCNQRMEVFCGASASALKGRPVAEALGLSQASAERFEQVFAESAAGQPRLLELELNPEGADAPRPLEAHLNLVRHETGDATVQLVARDISQRRQAQQERDLARRQLRASRRLEALGRLAGGVAHDFNNLLTLLLAHSDEIAMDERLPADVRELAREMTEASERAAGLTRQLLAFARKQVLDPRIINLDDVVGGMAPLLTKLVQEDVTVRVQADAEGACVLADPTQLEQVLVNLVVNARDAMPEGGDVVLSTQVVSSVDESGAPVQRALLKVTDTGAGMSAKTAERVFEPFFTTKSRQGGTGLGLATVHGVVNQSGGTVEVQSNLGQGTTFSIYLPLAEGEPEPPAARRRVRSSSAAATATVLMVDDEPAVRETAARSLRQAGYRVLSAADGTLALSAMEVHPGPIHLLITDVVMPKMGGRALAEALRRRDPDASVLFVSGHVDEALARGEEAHQPRQHFMPKPLRPAALLSRVEAILAGRNNST